MRMRMRVRIVLIAKFGWQIDTIHGMRMRMRVRMRVRLRIVLIAKFGWQSESERSQWKSVLVFGIGAVAI